MVKRKRCNGCGRLPKKVKEAVEGEMKRVAKPNHWRNFMRHHMKEADIKLMSGKSKFAEISRRWKAHKASGAPHLPMLPPPLRKTSTKRSSPKGLEDILRTRPVERPTSTTSTQTPHGGRVRAAEIERPTGNFTRATGSTQTPHGGLKDVLRMRPVERGVDEEKVTRRGGRRTGGKRRRPRREIPSLPDRHPTTHGRRQSSVQRPPQLPDAHSQAQSQHPARTHIDAVRNAQGAGLHTPIYESPITTMPVGPFTSAVQHPHPNATSTSGGRHLPLPGRVGIHPVPRPPPRPHHLN